MELANKIRSAEVHVMYTEHSLHNSKNRSKCNSYKLHTARIYRPHQKYVSRFRCVHEMSFAYIYAVFRVYLQLNMHILSLILI